MIDTEAINNAVNQFSPLVDKFKDTSADTQGDIKGFDIEKYLMDYSVETGNPKNNGKGKVYPLKECLFDSAHKAGDAAIILKPNGWPSYKCFHNSCQDKTWQEARRIISGKDSLKKYVSATRKTEPPLKASVAYQFEVTTLESIHALKLVDKPIVTDLLYEDEQTVIYADGGVGKSLVTEDMSMAIGSNMKSLWDIFEIPRYRAAMFVQSENGRLSVHQRTALKCKGNPDYIPGLSNVIYASQSGNIQVAGHVTDKTFKTALVDFTKSTEDSNGLKIEIIFWDPLISFHDAEENDNSRMRTTLDQILFISNEIKATPVVVHHANKEKGIRGATSIRDWARNIIKLEDVSYKGEKRIKFTHEKCNNHKMFDPFDLAMDEYLNFSPVEFEEIIPQRLIKRCKLVLEALELLGGSVEHKAELIEQYLEISGIKSESSAHNHINDAVNNNFIGREYYTTGSSKKKLARYFLP